MMKTRITLSKSGTPYLNELAHGPPVTVVRVFGHEAAVEDPPVHEVALLRRSKSLKILCFTFAGADGISSLYLCIHPCVYHRF